LKKKNSVGGTTQLNNKSYGITIMIINKIVWYHRKIVIDQWNRTEDPEIAHTSMSQAHTNMTKVQKQVDAGRTAFQQMVLKRVQVPVQ
jgi:hypothetical protein